MVKTRGTKCKGQTIGGKPCGNPLASNSNYCSKHKPVVASNLDETSEGRVWLNVTLKTPGKRKINDPTADDQQSKKLKLDKSNSSGDDKNEEVQILTVANEVQMQENTGSLGIIYFNSL